MVRRESQAGGLAAYLIARGVHGRNGKRRARVRPLQGRTDLAGLGEGEVAAARADAHYAAAAAAAAAVSHLLAAGMTSPNVTGQRVIWHTR